MPSWAYRQPDPLIYSQQYLQAQGLAVTWDNPDIHLELPGQPGVAVPSHGLAPDTEYIVVARIWNGSTTAPAIDLPVNVSYLEFGIGTVRHQVGLTTVDLPVKAAAGCPAFAHVPWRTPATPGHYCLQVELLWPDDANPANNMGQNNTDVKALNTPRAQFTFPVRNDRETARVVRLELDAYAVPPPERCPPAGHGDPTRHRHARVERHRRAAWPIPEGWEVSLEPREAQLAAGESTTVTVDVTAPDRFRGRQAVNVLAYAERELLGGVTLFVTGGDG